MADDRRREDARPGDPAEGVRIIGAEEAAEAIERGDVAERRGGNLPRYGDRPARPPAGPKPALRFPLEAGADADAPSLRPAKGQRFDPRPAPAWDEPELDDDEGDGDPWPAESTWGDNAGWDDDPQAEVAAWSRGETGTQPSVAGTASAAEPALAWAEDFVAGEDAGDDSWDGSWDEPTGAVQWADDEVDGPAVAATDDEAVVDVTDGEADDRAAFEGSDTEDEVAPKARRRFSRRHLLDDEAVDRKGEAIDDEADPVDDEADLVDDEVDLVDDEVGATLVVAADGGPEAFGDDEEWDVPEPDDDIDDAATAPAPWGEPSVGAPVVAAFEVSGETEAVAATGDDDRESVFDADGGWADSEKVFDFADEPSGQVALPHWTEPGTGELPRVLVDDDAVAAPGTSGPTPAAHWQSHDGIWSGEEGFDDLTDEDDDLRVGAMDIDRPSEESLYAFDEIDEMNAGDEPEPVAGRGDRRVAPARPRPEAEPAPTGGGAGRNLGVATAVGVGFAAVAGLLFFLGPKFALLLVIAILVVAIGEFQAATQRAGYRPSTLLGLAFTAFFPIAVYWKGIEAFPLLAVLTIVTALAWHLVGADGDSRVVESVGVTLFGVAWVAGLGSFAALLLSLPNGVGMLLTAVLAVVGYDVGGLAIGRTMGTKHISDVSPNKTLEGLLGGVLVSMFVVLVVVGLGGIAPWGEPGDALKIGLFAALAAPLGDLCESLVKRDLGIKDMGNLLPEHGGILDRFDGLLFVLPTVYYAAVLWGILPG